MRQFMLDVIFDELDKHEDMNTNISSLARSLRQLPTPNAFGV